MNQTFTVTTEAGSFEMIIKGIAPDQGFFKWDSNTLICSLAMGQKLAGTKHQINRIDLTLKSLDKIDETRDELTAVLEEYKLIAEEKFDSYYYDSFVSTIVLALSLFVMFTIVISIYIIYSVFRSYVYENIDEMATLRSIGFSIEDYQWLVFFQIIVIVTLASIFGIILSYPSMKLMLFLFNGYGGVVLYSPGYIFISVLVIHGIALVSGWLAIRKVVKTPITQLIKKGNYMVSLIGGRVMSLLGILLIASSVICYVFMEPYISVLAYYISTVLAIVGFILLQSLLVKIYSALIYKFFDKRAKGIGLVAKELKYNSASYIQSITIISIVLVIATLSLSVSAMLKNALGFVFKGADLLVYLYSEEYESAKDLLENHPNIDSYTM